MVLPTLALVVMAQVFNPPLDSRPFASSLLPEVAYESGGVTVAASPAANDPSFVAAWSDDRNGQPGKTPLLWIERIGLDGVTRSFVGLPLPTTARSGTLRLATGPSGIGLAWRQIGSLQRSFVAWQHLPPDGGLSPVQTVARADPTGFDIAMLPAGPVIATGENTGLALSGALMDRIMLPDPNTFDVRVSPLPDGGLAFAVETFDPRTLAGGVTHGEYGKAPASSSGGELLGLAPGLTRPSPHVLIKKPGEIASLELSSQGPPARVADGADFGTSAVGYFVLAGPAAVTGGPAATALTWIPIAASRDGGASQALFLTPSAVATMGTSVVAAGLEGNDVVAEWRNVGGVGSRRVLNRGPAARRHPTIAWNGADFVASVEVHGASRDLWRGVIGTPGVLGDVDFVAPTTALRLSMVQRTSQSALVAVQRPLGAELRDFDGGTEQIPGAPWAVADGLPQLLVGGPLSGQIRLLGATTAVLPLPTPPRCVASASGVHLVMGPSNGMMRAWAVRPLVAPDELPSLGPGTGSVCTKPSFATNELIATWAEGATLRVVVFRGGDLSVREDLTLPIPGASQPVNPIAMRLGPGIGVAWELERGDDIGFGFVRDGGLDGVSQLVGPQRFFGVEDLAMASDPEGTRLAIIWSAIDPRARARVVGGRVVGVSLSPADGGVEGDAGTDAGLLDGGVGDAGVSGPDAGPTATDGGPVGSADAGAPSQGVDRFTPACGCQAPGGLALLGLAALFWRRRRSR